jgi:phthiocerol/phenolphthiocerol synthesis type-I polyketide synthase C
VELPAARAPRQPFRITVTRPGKPDCAGFVPLVRRAPGPGMIEIEVGATAVNPTDVLKAAGLFPAPLTGPAALLGGECAGRVTAVGPDVTALNPGDRVVACAYGALASHVNVRADHAQRIPDGMDDAVAAGLPLVMSVAWHSLAHLGRLAAGETVLIHGAADTIGLAAVRVAGVLGARVIATADTDAKRAYLRDLGIAHVFDSRDLSWADQVRAATGGRGVDVLLNSISGAAVTRGLEVLAPDGRFVETGKQDIMRGRTISLSPFAAGISLAAVDIAGLVMRTPERFARTLETVWELVRTGKLEPLPVNRHPFAEAAKAIWGMAKGERPGRFVLTDVGSVTSVTALPMPGGRFRPDGTYLITGGLGALGLSLAEFLAANGAGALALLARSDAGPDAAGRLAALRDTGTRVMTVRCDVGDDAALRRALDTLRAELPPLRGVFHAAGVLSDATIANLTGEQLATVLTPKAAGARNLDAATADDPLDLFVLFSSAAALVGNTGQAAYAAGNAYLDALAEARRRRERPALSVQWGPFTEIGLAARDEGRGARLAERGMGGVAPAEAWAALVRMLDAGDPVAGYFPLDLRQWFDAYPDTAALRSWERLAAAAREAVAGEAAGGEFRTRLEQAPPEARRELAEEKVCELAGRVLRADPDGFERETPFKALGLDSLMSLELRNRLEAAFGIRLSPTLLWTYANPRALAGALCELVFA